MVLSIGDIPHCHGHHVVSIVCIEGSLCGVIYRGYTSSPWSSCCKYSMYRGVSMWCYL